MTSKQVTLPPWSSRKLVHSNEMVWAWRWSVALRTFDGQVLCSAVQQPSCICSASSCHPAWQSSYQALKQSSSQAASVQAATLQSCLAPPSTSWHQSRSHYHRGCICTLLSSLATMLSSCPAAKQHLLSIQAATLLGSLATKLSSSQAVSAPCKAV